MLILRRPWTEQPQDVAALRPDFIFNSAITGANAEGLTNLVAGAGWNTLAGDKWTPSGTVYMERSICAAGQAVKLINAATPHFYRTNTITTGPRTVVIVFVPSGTAATSGIWSIGSTSTSGGASFIAQQNGADLRLYAGASYAITLAGVCAANKPLHIVASFSNVANAGSCNVVLAANGVVGSASVTVSGESGVEYLGSGFNGVAQGWYAAQFGITSFFHAALAAEVSHNAWRLFEPRRIIVPVAAAGAGNTIAVPAGSLTLTGFAPTVTATANQVVEVPAGTLTLAGQTPTATSSDHQTISVPAGTLTLTANAPTAVASENQLISVPAGALTLAGQTPTVTASDNQVVAVPAGTLTLTGFEPNVLNGNQQVVQVPLGTLTLTGQTPAVAVSAHQVISVPTGTLTLAGQTPTVVATNPQLISVPAGTLTLTGFAPTVSNVGVNNQILVSLGTLTMSGNTPVVRVSTDADVFVDRFAARSRITQSLRFGSRITTQVGLRSPLKD